ncbi:MAG: glycosyltransferase family 4 protein [Candidatus Omnitrophota bacterium]|nr:glycosyltransferase family 4 protein [Candidatus Omnitrophota bacterium]
MRFLVLVTDAFGGRGGIAKFNRDLLTALCECHNSETVVAFPRLIVESVGALPAKLDYRSESAGSKIVYVIAFLRYMIRHKNVDLIVCGHMHLLPLAILARLLGLRAPIALVIHGIEAWTVPRPLISKLLIKWVSAVLSVSRFTLQRFSSWAHPNGIRTHILPNCVDLEHFTPGKKDPELLRQYGLEGKKVIMTLARLDARERYKGVDEVLEEMPALLKEMKELRYLIVGDGTDRKRLEIKARSLGIAKTVIFAGHISESCKVDHYRLANAYVMPGYGEGFGITYLEALACGVPAIGSCLDASQEVLEANNLGVTVDPRNSLALRKAITDTVSGRSTAAVGQLEQYSVVAFQHRVSDFVDEFSRVK